MLASHLGLRSIDMRRRNMFMSVAALFACTVLVIADASDFHIGTGWSASGSYSFMRGNVSIFETDSNPDHALTSHTYSSVDASPALNLSLSSSCSAACGGAWDNSNASPVVMSMGATATYTYTQGPVNPGFGPGTYTSHDYFLAVSADGGTAIASVSVSAPGLSLTSTDTLTGTSTVGFYTDGLGTVVSVNSGAVGMDGTSFMLGLDAGTLTATVAGSNIPIKTKPNTPFGISSTGSVNVTYH